MRSIFFRYAGQVAVSCSDSRSHVRSGLIYRNPIQDIDPKGSEPGATDNLDGA
jgi:hypothetical protein